MISNNNRVYADPRICYRVGADCLQGDNEQGNAELELSAEKDTSELTGAELMAVALSFYNLQHTHVIHEEDPDTKVIS